MKKHIFTFLIFSVFFSLNAQDFVGKDAALYLNTTVKPVEISEQLQEYAYKNFYLQFDTVTKALTKDYIGKKKAPFKPFQVGEYASTSVSDYSKLVGMEFKVMGVYEENPKYELDKGRHYAILPEIWTRGLVKKESNFTKRYEKTDPSKIFA